MRSSYDETGRPTKIGYMVEISKNDDFSKVVPMGSPGGRNVPTPRESILTLSRGSQLPYTGKNVFVDFYIELPINRPGG